MARPRPAGYVAEPGSSKANKTGSWRTEKPVFLHDTCTDCRICVLVCPDGIIFGADSIYDADFDFCKGCGICAAECPVDDIEMAPEVR
ncbi:MAG: pyruvate synthase [candidate division Zixibacteria bacterium]|nr:pyruvate synthase [candidate division Zixibacteria bacterium]